MVTEIFVEVTFVESTFRIKIDTLYIIFINNNFILPGKLYFSFNFFAYMHMNENDEYL